jgi:hypothetical protein
MIKGTRFKVEINDTSDDTLPGREPWQADLFITDRYGHVMDEIHSAAQTPHEALLNLARFWIKRDVATDTIIVDDDGELVDPFNAKQGAKRWISGNSMA